MGDLDGSVHVLAVPSEVRQARAGVTRVIHQVEAMWMRMVMMLEDALWCNADVCLYGLWGAQVAEPKADADADLDRVIAKLAGLQA